MSGINSVCLAAQEIGFVSPILVHHKMKEIISKLGSYENTRHALDSTRRTPWLPPFSSPGVASTPVMWISFRQTGVEQAFSL